MIDNRKSFCVAVARKSRCLSVALLLAWSISISFFGGDSLLRLVKKCIARTSRGCDSLAKQFFEVT